MIGLMPEDFKKLAAYIMSMPVDFMRAEDAVVIKKIIESAKMMSIEIKKENNVNSAA